MCKKGFAKAEAGAVITIVAGLLCIQSSAEVLPHFQMNSSHTSPVVVRMDFRAGGFSDWMYWGYNYPRHPYAQHEMLWGEWAAVGSCGRMGPIEGRDCDKRFV